MLFDLVTVINDVSVPDSSHKRATKDDALGADLDGSSTIKYLSNVRTMLRRICSNHPSSLGLHPAPYFYSPGGVFQAGALLAFTTLFKGWDTPDFVAFTKARAGFEEFLLAHRGITDAVRQLGSGNRSRPRILAFYRKVISAIDEGKTTSEIHDILSKDTDFSFLVVDAPPKRGTPGGKFNRETKGSAFLRVCPKTLSGIT
jgi:hypothetical protein